MRLRMYSALATMALAGTAILVGAQAASASTGDPHCNPGGYQGAMGVVCVIPQGTSGYEAYYHNITSNTTYVDFNLDTNHCGSTCPPFGDSGPVAVPGTRQVKGGGIHTYFFRVRDLGCGDVILYDRTGVLPPEYSGWSTNCSS